MSKVVDYFTGLTYDYDPALDRDEWIVCSLPNAGRATVGHATYSNFAQAKLCQLKLTIKGVEAWIEFIPALGPPRIEEQLDAMVIDSRNNTA